ncbi:hypothetical protein B0H14DRAFT_3854313 [Mycena olivaceomarginata]|nr:hypothetical protein B0H14DRAFT_3854313 [Mycena olivaceomarginata]
MGRRAVAPRSVVQLIFSTIPCHHAHPAHPQKPGARAPNAAAPAPYKSLKNPARTAHRPHPRPTPACAPAPTQTDTIPAARAAAACAARRAPPLPTPLPAPPPTLPPAPPCSIVRFRRHKAADVGLQCTHRPPRRSRLRPTAPPPCSDVGVGQHEGEGGDVEEVPIRDARAARQAPPAMGSRPPALRRPHRRPALMWELGGMRGWGTMWGGPRMRCARRPHARRPLYAAGHGDLVLAPSTVRTPIPVS